MYAKNLNNKIGVAQKWSKKDIIYFEGKTQEEIGRYYGISKSSMSELMDKIYITLKIGES